MMATKKGLSEENSDQGLCRMSERTDLQQSYLREDDELIEVKAYRQ